MPSDLLEIPPHLAKRNTEHGSGLGRWRWVIERTFAWLSQFRRLRVRYEKRADIHEAFLSLGCALICWHFLNRMRKRGALGLTRKTTETTTACSDKPRSGSCPHSVNLKCLGPRRCQLLRSPLLGAFRAGDHPEVERLRSWLRRYTSLHRPSDADGETGSYDWLCSGLKP